VTADEEELAEFEAIRELIAVSARHKRIMEERQRRREESSQRAVAFLEGTLASVLSRRCAQIVGGTWFVGRSKQSDRHAGVVAVPVKGEGDSFAYVISATVGRDGTLKIKRSVGTGEVLAEFRSEEETEYPPAVAHEYDLEAITGAEIVRDFTQAFDAHLRRRLGTTKKSAHRSAPAAEPAPSPVIVPPSEPWHETGRPAADDRPAE
jgi:hypothetical protein